MQMKNKRYNKGITLLALVVTIVILIILAGITISLVLGKNGILNKAKGTKETYAEQQAREKLEIELADLFAEKQVNTEYNENEYLTSKLEEKGFIVNEDIVFVDEWQFEIDRSIPEIRASLGKGTPNEEIKLTLSQSVSSDYVKSTIKAEIEYSKKLEYVQIAGEKKEELIKGQDGKYTVEKDVTKNGIYSVYVKDTEGKYNIKNIKVEEITEDISIKTAEELAQFRDNVNSGRTYEGRTVSLGADIDLSSVCGEEIGSWKPIGNETNKFKGSFYGSHYKVENLYINTTSDYQGLFGYVENANIEGIKLLSGMVKGHQSVAGIVGSSSNSKIVNCSNEASVTSTFLFGGGICGIATNTEISYCYNVAIITGTHSAGGICGIMQSNSTIDNCYNTGTIKTTTTGSINTNYIAGGISGYMSNHSGETTKIMNSYNSGSIYGYSHTGGITGMLEGNGDFQITNCYSRGILTGNRIYAISGWYSISRGTLTNNYWLEKCGASYGRYNSSNEGAISLSAEILQGYASTLGDTYTNDIQNDDGTWKYNDGYPILKWQLNVK